MKDYRTYFQSVASSISEAAQQLAHLVETEVPDKGDFPPVYVDWIDPKGELDIKAWRIKVHNFPACDGVDIDTRYVEIIGVEDGDYGISLLVYGGYQKECIASLKSPAFVERLIHCMIVCLDA